MRDVTTGESRPTGKAPQAPEEEHTQPAKVSQAPFSFELERVADALSRERLSKYLKRTGGDVERALALYEWNAELGAALNVVLSQTEICLRNRISNVLTMAFTPPGSTIPWHRVARLRNAHAPVQQELDKAEGRLTLPVPSLSDVVAACDFNLWRELCKPSYAGVFWARRIPAAFPHAPFTKGKERDFLSGLHRRVDLLLKLRNRIAHHEPIVGSNHEALGAKLSNRHSDAVELLNWMDRDLAGWVSQRDRFLHVMTACPE
jgi:hypothetical protein